MPFDQENVLFSSEYDATKFVAGISTQIASLRSLNDEQLKLQKTFEQTETQLSNVDKQLRETNDQIKALDKSSKDYAQTQSNLTKQADQLTKQQGELQSSLKSQKTQLDQVTQTNQKVVESFEKIQATAKKPITPVFDQSKIVSSLADIKTKMSATLKGFDFSGFEVLQENLLGAKGEVDQLAVALTAAKEKLATLDPQSDEFAKLNEVVQTGEQFLQSYNETQDQTGAKSNSLRSRLRQLRDEMTLLEDAGQDDTEQFRKLQIQAARLTDQYGDMQQRIRILASDTRHLDFGLAAVNTAASGFQAYTGALELFGLSSDTAAEAQKKLLAIMALVQGAQQLQTLLLKENTLRVVGADLATKIYSATLRIFGATAATATTSVKALSAALITTGIGALVVALGFLISKMQDWTSETEKAAAAQEKLNQKIKTQKEFFDEDIKLIDQNTKIRNEKLKQQGLSQASIYQSNLQGTKEKIQQINDQLAKLDEDRGTRSAEEQKLISARQLELIAQGEDLKTQAILEAEQERTRIAEEGRKKQKEISDKHIQDVKAANDLLSQIRLDLRLFGATDEQKELINLDDAFAKQKAILIKGGVSLKEATELYNKERNEIIARYGKLRIDEEVRIMNELDQLQLEANAKRIENIKTEFDREISTIRNENEKQKQALQQQQTDLLNSFVGDRNSEQFIQFAKSVNDQFEILFDALAQNTADKLKEAAAKAFQSALDNIQKLNEKLVGQIHISANKEIIATTQLYTTGAITYKEYQERLTKISQEETAKRLQAQRAEIAQQLVSIGIRSTQNISDQERKALVDQADKLKGDLSNIDKEIADNQAGNFKSTEDANLQHLHNMLNAYGSFVDGVVGFIADLDRAESAQLERRISYQQQRVEFARQIAEKGNAQYLELEQKRLDALQAQQEAHAQKQLAIDNALTLSKAALAAVGAVADAVGSGNPFLAIAAVVAVIAAIGAAFNFVNSLKTPVAQFAEGTLFVDDRNAKDGVDTVPAKLTKGEAVIPRERNLEYKKTVEAIYYKSVPADVLNRFVAQYPTVNVPEIDFSRLSNATDNYFTNSSVEGNHKLGLIYDQLAMLNENMSNVDNLNINFDERGFSLSLMRTLKQIKLLKRS